MSALCHVWTDENIMRRSRCPGHLHREALGYVRHFALRRVDNLRLQVEIRSFGVIFMMRWRWQVGRPDVPAYTGGVTLPGAESMSLFLH